MSEINVLVVTTSRDVKAAIAEAIAEAVAVRSDMSLVEGRGTTTSRCVSVNEVDTILPSLDPSVRCAAVLVGREVETTDLSQRLLSLRNDLEVMHVDIVDGIVRIGLRDADPDSLLTALHEVVMRAGRQRRERVTRMPLRPVESSPEPAPSAIQVSAANSLLERSLEWIHAVLQNAVEAAPDDVNGFTITRQTLLSLLGQDDRSNERGKLTNAELALSASLASVDTNPEPLAIAADVFGLGPLEFQMMVLTLAPELDIRFQRCIGFLLDDASRRVGTIGLYCDLLGLNVRARDGWINRGALVQWRVFEDYADHPRAADEPLRVDPFLAGWLLGDRQALQQDPRVRRMLRLIRWPGYTILKDQEERAARLIEKIQGGSATRWIVLDGDDPVAWRALVERGALHHQFDPIRVVAVRLVGIDLVEVEEVARRIGRLARLTRRPLIIDVSKTDGTEAEDEYLGLFLVTLQNTGCRAAVICCDEGRIVQLLGDTSYELITEPSLSKAARVEAVRVAALGADAYLTEESATSIADRYPLQVDGLEQAMRLAASRPKNFSADHPDLERLITAFKQLASERISHLVERIEPSFTLEQVVLPPDRKRQLEEIVDQIRLASRVLDDWKFRAQLPYGRGVAALFFGASGTGKTMAAMGIARRLDIQILRLDLSRVVSKYIGETEKNIDRVFTDAQASGAAILIDEADALLGKRSEVKDAHDRYANIEVAYLLQRMEAYEGLVILTTNMRKNLDAAFLRRLRFVIEFPRPDAPAREKIWRQCLPYESHELTDADFRQLARRIDVTGGQIRQITVRAAFIAAAAEKLIGLEHIVQAASAELAKLGMPPIEVALLQTRRAAA